MVIDAYKYCQNAKRKLVEEPNFVKYWVYGRPYYQ